MARELAITVLAEVQQAIAALENVEKTLQGVEKQAEAAGASTTKTAEGVKEVGEAAKAAAGNWELLSAQILKFATPVAIGAAFKQTLNYADAISDLSRRTGIGVVALQQFEVVAKMNGNSLDQLARVSQVLGDKLASGDKSAAGAMKKLGLSTEDMLALSPEDRLREVAKATSELGSQAV